MAQAYEPTGGSLSSTTLVSALVEIATLLNAAEGSYNAANPTRQKNQITVSVNGDERSVDVNATLPIVQTLSTSGMPVFDVTDYLGATYSAFNGGSDGTALKSTDLPSAFLEIAHRVQAAELAFPENDRPNAVQIEYSSDAQQVTVTCSMPCTIATATGGALIATAVDYL